MKKEAPNYLINLIPKCEAAIRTRNNKFLTYNCLTDCFKYFFFFTIDLKLLTRLRLGLIHLNEHKFLHNFEDCLNPLCSYSLEIEDTTHYLLHCQNFSKCGYDL